MRAGANPLPIEANSNHPISNEILKIFLEMSAGSSFTQEAVNNRLDAVWKNLENWKDFKGGRRSLGDNSYDQTGYTPIHYAALLGNFYAYKWLLQEHMATYKSHSSDPNLKTRNVAQPEETAFTLAISYADDGKVTRDPIILQRRQLIDYLFEQMGMDTYDDARLAIAKKNFYFFNKYFEKVMHTENFQDNYSIPYYSSPITERSSSFSSSILSLCESAGRLEPLFTRSIDEKIIFRMDKLRDLLDRIIQKRSKEFALLLHYFDRIQPQNYVLVKFEGIHGYRNDILVDSDIVPTLLGPVEYRHRYAYPYSIQSYQNSENLNLIFLVNRHLQTVFARNNDEEIKSMLKMFKSAFEAGLNYKFDLKHLKLFLATAMKHDQLDFVILFLSELKSRTNQVYLPSKPKIEELPDVATKKFMLCLYNVFNSSAQETPVTLNHYREQLVSLEASYLEKLKSLVESIGGEEHKKQLNLILEQPVIVGSLLKSAEDQAESQQAEGHRAEGSAGGNEGENSLASKYASSSSSSSSSMWQSSQKKSSDIQVPSNDNDFYQLLELLSHDPRLPEALRSSLQQQSQNHSPDKIGPTIARLPSSNNLKNNF